MPQTSALSLEEGVLLGHALVAAVAEAAGARVLLIKGPRQDELGLRAGRQSVDIDAWVHPDDFHELQISLASYGWRVRSSKTAIGILPPHSATLTNVRWPCEVDLHHRFPGMFADPSIGFDAFWNRREASNFAGVVVQVPDLIGSIVLAALHLVRDEAARRLELDDLIDRARALLAGEEFEDITRFADQIGASSSLSDFLRDVGAAKPKSRASSADQYAWAVQQGSSVTSGAAWLFTLQKTPWLKRPAVLVCGFLLTEAELRERHPSAPVGPRGLWLARWWRLKRVARRLPQTYRLLWRARRRL